MGVPVICNDFLPLAARIEATRSGWTVAEPAALPGLLRSIAAVPIGRGLNPGMQAGSWSVVRISSRLITAPR